MQMHTISLYHQEDLMKRIFPKDNDISSASVQSDHCHQTGQLLSTFRELDAIRDEHLVVRRDRAAAQLQCHQLMSKLKQLKEQYSDSTVENTDTEDPG